MIGYTIISRLYNDSEANLVRTILESYGIPVTVSSDLTHTVYPLTVDGLGEIRVWVPDESREEAEKILEAHRAEGRDLGA